MANHPSQQQLISWNQPDEEVPDNFCFPLDNYDFDAQHSIQPPTTFENFLDTSLPQNQGMEASFDAGSQLAHSDTGIYPSLYQNLSYLPENAPLPPAPMNYSLGAGVNGGAFGVDVDYTASQEPFSGMYHDYSGQNVPFAGGDFEFHGPVICGQFRMEQIPPNDLSTLLTGEEDMQNVTTIPSGFSHFQSSIHGSESTESLTRTEANHLWNPAQFSSTPYFCPFGESLAEISGMDYNFESDDQILNQPIIQGVGAEWGQLSSPRNCLAGVTSAEFSKGVGSSENPIQITESPVDVMDSQPSTNTIGEKNRTPKPFGPSRAVSLPPSRRGGRKGPLPKAELERRREARKQGVCIRCRALNQKCHGFPCRSCLKKSKAVLWKFPCTKAQFLDLVEFGSYFEDMHTLQKIYLENLNRDVFVKFIELIHTCFNSGFFTRDIAIDSESYTQILMSGIFQRGLKVFQDILERASNYDSPPSRQMIEMPYRLTHSESSLPPVVINGSISEKTTDKLERIIIFCSSESMINLRPKNNDMSKDSFRELVKKAIRRLLNIFWWLSRRYYEILLFRNLQSASNRLSSLSTGELSKMIITILDILTLDLVRLWKTQRTAMHANTSSDKVYEDRRTRIRQALFIYLALALDKLPAWYNFWQSVRKSYHRAIPDISKHRITDLESFDWYSRCELERAKAHMALLFPKSACLDITRPCVTEEPIDPSIANTDFEVHMSTVSEIFYGPRNEKEDLEAIFKRLTSFYQPMFEFLEKILNEMDESMPPPLLKLSRIIRHASEVIESIRRKMEMGLEIQQGSQRLKEERSSLKDFTQISLESSAHLDLILQYVRVMLELPPPLLQHDSACG